VNRRKKLPSVGSAFAFQLGNGMYGACRVLRFIEKRANDQWDCDAVLVACCEWIGDSVPSIDTCNLSPILKLSHHRWNTTCINWITTPVIDALTHIGAVPPSPAELSTKCDSTVTWTFLPTQRLAQWEWDNNALR
jgi:hypothetical protein